MTTITLPRAVVEQALEALESVYGDSCDALHALRAALAEPVLAPAPCYCKHCKQYTIEEPLPAEPVQEPVAQVHPNHLKPTDDGKPWCREVLLYSGDHNGDLSKGENYRVKLYTAPPQRPVEPIEPTPTFHVEPLKWGCGVCRIGADGKAYGYVCPRLDCPTKVTCGGAV